MSEHVHKWRKITGANKTMRAWLCTYSDSDGGCLCGEEAEWCCGKQPLGPLGTGDRECWDGRCAEHGPKPRKPKERKPAPFARWSVRKPNGYARGIEFDGLTVLQLSEGTVRNEEMVPIVVRALNAAKVVLPKLTGVK